MGRRKADLTTSGIVQVTNLHIRYEDSVTQPGHSFAVGLTLHSIGAFTVDDSGNEIFVKKAAMQLLRKAAQLSRLTIYFDTGACLNSASTSESKLHHGTSVFVSSPHMSPVVLQT
jgi:hypothetical protein